MQGMRSGVIQYSGVRIEMEAFGGFLGFLMLEVPRLGGCMI